MIFHLLGRLLGLHDTQSVEGVSLSLGARWAHDAPAWLLFGCVGLAALAVVFYVRWQGGKGGRHNLPVGPEGASHKLHLTPFPPTRLMLAAIRALTLSLILLALAEPVLVLQVTSRFRAALWLLFDGTDSMNIADDLPAADRARLLQAVGLDESQLAGATAGVTGGSPARAPSGTAGQGGSAAASAAEHGLSRIESVKALVEKKEQNLLARLEKEFRLRGFLFDRANDVRLLDMPQGFASPSDRKQLARQLTAEGQVTAIGGAMEDLARRHATGSLAGLVIFSDFNQNAGAPALEAARQLGVKVYTVGVGPADAVNVAVSLQAPLVTKKDERATLVVTLTSQGLANQQVTVRLAARAIGGGEGPSSPVPIGQRSVRLVDAVQTVAFPFVPDHVGQFEMIAEVDAVPGESARDSHRATREMMVRDDFIRLMYVEYEPTWEWRFIKEVFHRDKLVGMRGFRTFLRSSDPKVRQTNELFLPSISPERSAFFAYDVILLGDMPAAALGSRFCEMVQEFVGNFGGGLVVMAGPRFGPGQLAETPLAKMLPVIVDGSARIRDREPFALVLRPEAALVDFMQLGTDAAENQMAWSNLGRLPWYQPVDRVHPLGEVLAEHPSDTCSDGKTHQPLLALRRYGRGEVVYLASNETWRLRRKFGEQYYRQFWGQMIHRLALSHALGSQKRFVVRTDRRRYQADEQVLLTVEAYDKDFQPLAESAAGGGVLSGELVLPEEAARDGRGTLPLRIPAVRKGLFETRFPVFAGGEHRVRVKDPLGGQVAELTFQVASVSVERQRAVRNVALQQAVADATGGKSYDLTTVDQLPDEIRLARKSETTTEIVPLWNTWFYFFAVVLLLWSEWAVRKWINLP
jgi:hypothetical protein